MRDIRYIIADNIKIYQKQRNFTQVQLAGRGGRPFY